MAGHVFARGSGLPLAVSAQGCVIRDAQGREYLDASGGAIVVGVGHGRTSIARVMAAQAGSVAYVHGTAFSTDAIEAYTDELAPVLPMDDPHVYPVAGGSEAVETALKMARAYHLARGQDRSIVIGRRGSYHGNSRGALDVSGRQSLRAPYQPWLGPAVHTGTPQEYRCGFKRGGDGGDAGRGAGSATPAPHPHDCGRRHAAELEELIQRVGPDRVAAFIAEPIAGAALAACVPPEDYWPAVAQVCRRHGVLLIADEVMTGFGRTGRWFGSDHWGVRPDLLTAGKGAGSGYLPLGLAVASGQVHETITAAGGLVHGFTYSHHAVGAAVGREVLRILTDEGLVDAAARQGEVLRAALTERLGDHPHVGDIRGRGLLVGIEFVADRETKRPFPRQQRLTEHLIATAKERGLLLYPATGCADGREGDAVVIGPPLTIDTDQIDQLTDTLAATLIDRTRGRAAF